MKKTFLTKRNAIFSSTSLSWGGYALSAVLVLLFVRLLAPNFFWHVFTPVFRAADALAIVSHTFFSSFGDTATLALQNEKLQSENSALALENQALLRKVASVGELVGTPTTGKKTMSEILAGVIARPPESPYDTLVLAEGTSAGVAVGMEAFGPGNVPVGIVSSVLNDFSRVVLFSSPGMRTSGWVGHGSVGLTIFGSGAGTLSASIARSAGVSVGDIVSVPGPGQLPIGKVVYIESDPASPSVLLRIQLAVNPFTLSWVVLRDTGIASLKAFSLASSTLP